jgi:hypothetical protein
MYPCDLEVCLSDRGLQNLREGRITAEEVIRRSFS